MIFLPDAEPLLAFQETYLPLAELCARLAKAERTEIVCRADIRERKLALFTTPRPLSEIRTAVETFAGLKFERLKTGWRLIPDPEWEKAEGEYERAENRLRDLGVVRSLDRWAELSRLTIEERTARAKESERQYVRAKPAERDAAYNEYLRYFGADQVPNQDLWAGLIWRSLDAAGRQRMLDGGVGTLATPGLLSRPDAVLPASELGLRVRYDDRGRTETPDNRAHLMLLGRSPTSGEISGVVRSWESPIDRNIMGLDVRPDRKSADWAELRRLTYFRLAEEWKGVDPAMVKIPVVGTGEVPKVAGPHLVSHAEHLAWLHARTGVSIIGETFRRPVFDRRPLTGKTVGEWIESYNRQDTTLLGVSTDRGRLRASGGWVGVLPDSPWNARRREVPERIIRAFAQSPNLRGAMTYAQSLTEGQIRPDVRRLHPIPFGGDDFISLSTLRLLAVLPRGDGPWRYRDLPAPARLATDRWFRDRAFDGFFSPKLAAAIAPNGPGLPEDVTVRIVRTGKTILMDEIEPRMGPNGYGGPNMPQSEYPNITVRIGAFEEDSLSGAAVLFRGGPRKRPGEH